MTVLADVPNELGTVAELFLANILAKLLSPPGGELGLPLMAFFVVLDPGGLRFVAAVRSRVDVDVVKLLGFCIDSDANDSWKAFTVEFDVSVEADLSLGQNGSCNTKSRT